MSGDMKSVSELFSHGAADPLDLFSGKEKWGWFLCSQGCLMLWIAVLEG